MRRIFALSLGLILSACSPVQILNALAPSAGITAQTGIAYAADPERQLDVYAPAVRCPAAPVVLFFYGGGWVDGDRATYRFLGAALARRGVMAVIPDYRQYPQARFPAFMDDAAAALAWTRDNAARYGGNPGAIFLMGHSAGAQIATLLALDTHYMQAAGVDPALVKGVIGLSGPYDFLPLTDPALQAIFGPEADWPRSQPINFVTPAAPPMFLATGTADDTVYPRNTTHLAARLQQAGVPVEVRYYQGLGHELMIGAFASQLKFFAPSRHDSLDFIARHVPVARVADTSCASLPTEARIP